MFIKFVNFYLTLICCYIRTKSHTYFANLISGNQFQIKENKDAATTTNDSGNVFNDEMRVDNDVLSIEESCGYLFQNQLEDPDVYYLWMKDMYLDSVRNDSSY